MPVDGNSDLREQLEQVLQGRVCWMGVGNFTTGMIDSESIWPSH